MFTDPIKKVEKFRNQTGQGFSEYSLLLMLVVVVVAVAVRVLGSSIAEAVDSLVGQLF